MVITGYTWFAILFLLAYGVCDWLVRRKSAEKLKASLRYSVTFNTDEVFRGEYLYIDQVIENVSDRTIPFLKIETLLPEGLSIVLVETAADRAAADRVDEPNAASPKKPKKRRRDETVHSAESLWSLAPHSRITRRWRVLAETRGRYMATDVQVLVISNDALGMGAYSITPELTPSGGHTVLVLPQAAEWLSGMAPADALTGTGTVPHGLIQDPMAVAGVRPYDAHDPLNMIDWKQSAHTGSLMVRKTEAVENDAFNIVLNMQSKLEEPRPSDLSSPWHVEEAITVCASLLDSAVRRNIPVRLIANTPPDPLVERGVPGGPMRDDERGRQIFCSEEFRGGDATMEAYRLLADLPLVRSVPAEALSDDIIANPEYYIRGGNVLFVTPYLDARMVAAYERLRSMGVRVIFYVITTEHHATTLPDEGDIYFKPTGAKGGVGYGY